MEMNRRDFSKMVIAAVGGIVAGGSLVGCSGDGDKKESKDHMCAGKNECKGMGGCHTASNSCGGKNECKGKGGCASASMKHECKTKNACKGQGMCKTGDGGCAGKNTCKGKGGCACPPKK